jgi:hypothetical protein
LRHTLQTCESTQRQVHRALGIFADHFISATETLPESTRTDLLTELARIRLLLSGNGGGR